MVNPMASFLGDIICLASMTLPGVAETDDRWDWFVSFITHMFHVIMGFNMGFNMADMYQFYGDVTETIWNMMEYDHQTYTCLGKL